MDYYELLGVDQYATLKEIKEAYKQLTKRFNKTDNEKYSLNMLTNVNKAYNVLSDSNSRVQYDMKRNNQCLFNEPFQNMITKMHNSFTEDIFDMKLPVFNLPSENVYSKSYSISSIYDSNKGVNHVKKVINENGKQHIEEYDQIPKYIDSWGLTRGD